MLPRRVVCHVFIASAALALAGCTAAQIQQAFTGHPATTQPSTAPPTAGSIEGVTQQLQTLTATVQAASTGTPIGTYAALASAVFAFLLTAERAYVKATGGQGQFPNSNGSPSQSNSASGGGTNSLTGQPSSSASLKAA